MHDITFGKKVINFLYKWDGEDDGIEVKKSYTNNKNTKRKLSVGWSV